MEKKCIEQGHAHERGFPEPFKFNMYVRKHFICCGSIYFFSYFEADNWKEHFSFFALQFKMKEKSKTIINFYRRPGG